MSRLLKVVALTLLVFLAAGALFAQAAQPKAAWPAYGLSIFLGFGTGHNYAGANGTPFLVADLVGVGAMVGGAVIAVASGASAVSTQDPSMFGGLIVGYGVIAVGSLVFLVARIVEVVDIFPTVDKQTKAGKVAAVVPVVEVQRTSLELGFSVKY